MSVERQPRKIVAVPLDAAAARAEDFGRPHGVQLGRLIEAVFQNRQAGPDLARVEHQFAHLEQHVFHLRRGRRVERRGRGDFAHADDHHFREPALHRPGKAGVQLDAIEHEHAGRFERVAIHPNVAVETVPSFTTSIDARIGMPIACFGHAERLDHSPAGPRRCRRCDAHRGEQERLGAVWRSQSPAALVIAAILAMPRLPAVMPTSPCGTFRLRPSSCAWTAAGYRRSDWRRAFDGRGGISWCRSS